MSKETSGVRRRASDALDSLTAEAREEGATPDVLQVDWSRVDDQLFSRIFSETSSLAPPPRSFLSRAAKPAAFVAAFALAAATLVYVGSQLDGLAPAASTEARGDSVANHGSQGDTLPESAKVNVRSGSTLVNGALPKSGAELRVDDSLIAQAGGAVFERKGVIFGLEAGARSVIKRGDAHLVVALEEGAIEAQVTPVPMGEAFAVDVGSVRVAVHGTHFRVERRGDQVVVDLTEGIVSVGAPSRVGPTYGRLVTAPAHVEFAIAHPDDSLRETHDVNAVRAAVSFAPPVGPSVGIAGGVTEPSHEVATASKVAIADGSSKGRAAKSNPPSSGVAKLSAEATEASVKALPAAEVPQDPAQAIQVAVQKCFDARESAGEVAVSVNTTLDVTVAVDGTIRVAAFHPPLPPDVQQCASSTIYAQHFSPTGTRSIPIQLRHK